MANTITIDGLNPSPLPSRLHRLPVMKDGVSHRLDVDALLKLALSTDVTIANAAMLLLPTTTLQAVLDAIDDHLIDLWSNASDDAAAIVAINTALANRLRFDVAQTIDAAGQLRARQNIGAVGGRFVAPVIFTASGTYTLRSSVAAIDVLCIGGGGGGGGAVATSAGLSSGGSGGGGGSSARKFFRRADLSSGPYSMIVGAGGAGGAGVSGEKGAVGGETRFSTLVRAGGGDGGTSGADSNNSVRSGGAGGVATLGDILVRGAPGGPGFCQGSLGLGGNGGASIIGDGGAGITASGGGQSGGQGLSGGGGAGASNSGGSAPVRTGGNGGAGLIIIWEYE
ncbi:hypothetical protein [Mesorhizobium sp. CAU 1732]|uniref:glycine-rich domain-containing protein n=1 Tax=Mesorhizobium sp. CAU 1732 TaxID=3140358 RepID=UPI003261553C